METPQAPAVSLPQPAQAQAPQGQKPRTASQPVPQAIADQDANQPEAANQAVASANRAASCTGTPSDPPQDQPRTMILRSPSVADQPIGLTRPGRSALLTYDRAVDPDALRCGGSALLSGTRGAVGGRRGGGWSRRVRCPGRRGGLRAGGGYGGRRRGGVGGRGCAGCVGRALR